MSKTELIPQFVDFSTFLVSLLIVFITIDIMLLFVNHYL